MQYKIKDESGDKEFFTIIPNFIINHSTAIDKALYLEMKRFAGENGKCFATEKTIMKRLSIGKKSFDKSLNYLLNKKWITFKGLTTGKTRPIKTYTINNIWNLNSTYYNKISSESNISLEEDKSPKLRDKSPKQHKISSESNVEEELYKEDIKEDITEQSSENNTLITEVFNIFKRINPTINFGHKTQRQSVLDILTSINGDKEQLITIVEYSVSIQGEQYAPTITNPYQLKTKLGDLRTYKKRQDGKSPTII